MRAKIELDRFAGVHVSRKRQADLTCNIDLFHVYDIYLSVQPYLESTHSSFMISSQCGILLQLYAIYLITNIAFEGQEELIGALAVAVGISFIC